MNGQLQRPGRRAGEAAEVFVVRGAGGRALERLTPYRASSSAAAANAEAWFDVRMPRAPARPLERLGRYGAVVASVAAIVLPSTVGHSMAVGLVFWGLLLVAAECLLLACLYRRYESSSSV